MGVSQYVCRATECQSLGLIFAIHTVKLDNIHCLSVRQNTCGPSRGRFREAAPARGFRCLFDVI